MRDKLILIFWELLNIFLPIWRNDQIIYMWFTVSLRVQELGRMGEWMRNWCTKGAKDCLSWVVLIEGEYFPVFFLSCFAYRGGRASLIAQLVKNWPAMQETQVWFLGQEDPLEKRQATHSSILRLPLWLSWLRILLQCGRRGFDPWVGKITRRRKRLPTPVYWPEEFHGFTKSQTRLRHFHFHFSQRWNVEVQFGNIIQLNLKLINLVEWLPLIFPVIITFRLCCVCIIKIKHQSLKDYFPGCGNYSCSSAVILLGRIDNWNSLASALIWNVSKVHSLIPRITDISWAFIMFKALQLTVNIQVSVMWWNGKFN